MNYYLISPKADGKTINGFIEKMFDQHIVMMGWSVVDSKIGEEFNQLKNGDFVIVAQRVNWKFNYFFAGIIDDDASYEDKEGFQCRKLRNFVDLRTATTDYLADVSFAEMRAIKAMMAINPQKNSHVISILDTIIQKQMEQEQVDYYINLLIGNHNLILSGAPGTGKTYLAQQIAQQLIFGEVKENTTDEEKKQFNEQCGFVQFHPSYDYTDFVEGLRPINKGGQLGFERKDGIFKSFCQKALLNKGRFDSAYENLKNAILNGNNNCETYGSSSIKFAIEHNNNPDGIKFTKTNGDTKNAFKERLQNLYYYFINKNITDVRNANHDEMVEVIGGTEIDYTYYRGILQKIIDLGDKPHIFIIDEINRGEISKIFGELFFSIDPGYRGEKGLVNTQYQNLIPKEDDDDFDESKADIFRHGFYVPENVYIIGTMNDIDRSVESMDFAFRRRFAFREILAEERATMLNEIIPEQADEAKKRMKNLNLAIETIEGLSKAYHIGPAYFLKLKNYLNDEESWDSLWKYHLEGLLREYLRGMPNVDENLKELGRAYKLEEIYEKVKGEDGSIQIVKKNA